MPAVAAPLPSDDPGAAPPKPTVAPSPQPGLLPSESVPWSSLSSPIHLYVDLYLFTGTTGRLQPIAHKESLQPQGRAPRLLQIVQILGRHLKQRALRDQHLRIGGAHLPIARQVQPERLLSARHD